MIRTKTRASLEHWCANEANDGFEEFSKAQLKLLLLAGKSVCLITFRLPNGKGSYGTGFRFGGDWVMTNFHVVQNDTTNAFETSNASFSFLDLPVIPGRQRSAICSDLIAYDDDRLLTSPVKDLALIHIPGLNGVQALYDSEFEMPNVGDRICLVHHGGDSTDQKFSFGKITKFDFKDETHQNFYIESDVWCPDGCSGSPLLWFSKKKDKFCVIAVIDAGTDDSGDALVYAGNHWIQSTLESAICISTDIVGKINSCITISNTIPLLADSAAAMREKLLKQLRQLNTKLMEDKLLVFLSVDVADNHEHVLQVLQHEKLSKITIS